ncbi:MAG: type II secretion system protein M [Moraxellaceae bacterium]
MSAWMKHWQGTVAPYLLPLRQRWQQLESREQRALQALGVVLLLVVLVFGLWLPSHRAAARVQQSYENSRQLLLWMQDNAGQVRRAPAAGGSVLGTANVLAGSSGLALTRVEPQGDDGVRVWIERADFNAVAGWLAQLVAQGVRIDEAQVERRPEGGVSGRFTLTR